MGITSPSVFAVVGITAVGTGLDATLPAIYKAISLEF
jgi:hypothetical protein